MDTVIVGNVISFLGASLMVVAGFLKKRDTILTVQCAQFGLMGLANCVLGGFTGAISSLVSIVRNLVSKKRVLGVPLKLTFIALQTALSLGVGARGWIDWLPVASACLYTWMIDARSPVRLKIALILAQVFWVAYDLTILNYVAFCFDIFTIMANLLGILRLRRRKPEQ